MKFKCILMVCYITFISSISAKSGEPNQKLSSEELANENNAGAGKTDESLNEHLLKEANGVSEESGEHKLKKGDVYNLIKHHENISKSLKTQLDKILANRTKLSNITDGNKTKPSTPYDVKHYLTANQKYYMLRINLLGVGIRVVHDIIPIPVANTEEYKKSMEVLLDRVQAARQATANITAGNMHNITLEDAHKLQMEMTRAGEMGSSEASKKSPSRTTEVMIVIGAVVGIVIIGVLIFICKRAMDGKSASPYYDHMHNSGGAVPLN